MLGLGSQGQADPMHQCLLCNTENSMEDFYHNEKSEVFWKCQHCGIISKAPEFHPTPEAENARYQLHQNDVLDLDYQKFLKPVVDVVLREQSPQSQGLDFGSGRASVIAHLLRQKNYQITEFDPLFFPNEQILYSRFDYITCTEVVEHFKQPRKSFDNLLKLLKPGGKLYLKTSLTDSISDFSKWYYHRDSTHVSFYNEKSLEYIKQNWALSHFEICKDYIVFDRGFAGF